jgi:hypothetical protein
VGKARRSSKFGVNDLLFKPEPPVAARDVKALFQGRAAELERGRETLKANLDIEGRRSKRTDKRPWVIHGESRSGKSHLARRILADLPERKDRIKLLIPSGGRLDALAVMRDLFETLRGEYKTRILDQTLREDPLNQPAIQLVEQLVEKIGMFASGVQAVELTHEAGERDSVDLGAELGGAPLLFKFLTKYQTERTRKNAIKVTLRAPVALDLAEVCGIMVEALLRLRLVKHALILVDDVDLLEGYVNAQQNARQQRPVLAAALHALHATPGVDLVLTARSWYAHAQKDLSPLVEQAIRDGRRTVDVAAGNPFFGTVLDNEFVHQSYDSETTYFISGVMLRLLREALGLGGGITR